MTRTALGRRAFLGLGGASIAGVVIAGCGEDEEAGGGAAQNQQTQQDQQADVVLDFGAQSDLPVVNYAYALEQLEAAFYATALEKLFDGASASDRQLLQDLQAHETAHREFFAAKLGDKAIPALTPDFSKVDFSSRQSVLKTAQTFENIGVWAYNGAASLIDPGGPLGVAPLKAAGDIVSVEARHASAVTAALEPGRGDFSVDAFDKALPPDEVVSMVAPFIKTKIAVRNVPQQGGQS